MISTHNVHNCSLPGSIFGSSTIRNCSQKCQQHEYFYIFIAATCVKIFESGGLTSTRKGSAEVKSILLQLPLPKAKKAKCKHCSYIKATFMICYSERQHNLYCLPVQDLSFLHPKLIFPNRHSPSSSIPSIPAITGWGGVM